MEENEIVKAFKGEFRAKSMRKLNRPLTPTSNAGSRHAKAALDAMYL